MEKIFISFQMITYTNITISHSRKKIAYINIHKINTGKYRTAYCNMKLFLKI